MSASTPSTLPRSVKLAIVVSALGYFVDIYDLILFSVVRVTSLKDLGVAENDLLIVGSQVLDAQMYGMLLGGVLWGVLGDKKGRLSVLFGSILMYSLANIANGFVTTPELYQVFRFIAGLGLAGELGAGVTLVSELLSKEKRGIATTAIASFGICGALLAVAVSKLLLWRNAYFLGGGMGLLLLLFRMGTLESKAFRAALESKVSRGNFFALFAKKERARKYLSLVLVGVPIWYSVGVLVTFSKEIGKDLRMTELPDAAYAVLFMYLGLAVGDLASGLLSQYLRSRKRALLVFLVATCASIAAYFTLGAVSATALYGCCLALGFSTGYWAVFVTMGSEQFGTNLRATAATTAPNVVRGSVPLLGFLTRKVFAPSLGLAHGALLTGVLVMVVALLALRGLEETFGKSLDFLEE
jgi:MFS transporter, putative metabolite:H+ symporter